MAKRTFSRSLFGCPKVSNTRCIFHAQNTRKVVLLLVCECVYLRCYTSCAEQSEQIEQKIRFGTWQF